MEKVGLDYDNEYDQQEFIRLEEEKCQTKCKGQGHKCGYLKNFYYHSGLKTDAGWPEWFTSCTADCECLDGAGCFEIASRPGALLFTSSCGGCTTALNDKLKGLCLDETKTEVYADCFLDAGGACTCMQLCSGPTGDTRRTFNCVSHALFGDPPTVVDSRDDGSAACGCWGPKDFEGTSCMCEATSVNCYASGGTCLCEGRCDQSTKECAAAGVGSFSRVGKARCGV